LLGLGLALWLPDLEERVRGGGGPTAAEVRPAEGKAARERRRPGRARAPVGGGCDGGEKAAAARRRACLGLAAVQGGGGGAGGGAGAREAGEQARGGARPPFCNGMDSHRRCEE